MLIVVAFAITGIVLGKEDIDDGNDREAREAQHEKDEEIALQQRVEFSPNYATPSDTKIQVNYECGYESPLAPSLQSSQGYRTEPN